MWWLCDAVRCIALPPLQSHITIARASCNGTLPERNTPWHQVGSSPGRAFDLVYEDVAFPAEDGQTLRGWFG